jgi:lipoprotein NlpI
MRFAIHGLIACAVLAAGASPTPARADDRYTCAIGRGDDAIEACSRAIASRRYSGRDLAAIYYNRGMERHGRPGENGDNERDRERDRNSAIADYTEAIRLYPQFSHAYNNRGLVWRDKGNTARAIADYDAAIKLEPKYAKPYNNRGNVRRDKGELDSAIADYGQAISLEAEYANAYENRGEAQFIQANFAAAAADLQRAVELAAKLAAGQEDAAASRDDGSAMLWRFLARSRMGEDAASELAASAEDRDSDDWAAPVIELYLGRSSVEKMRQAATTDEQKCEAAFYAGEWQLVRRDSAAATAELQSAVKICEKTSVEYMAAVAELKRLKP